LPGPIARGNSVADECTCSLFVFMSASPVQLAADFHRNFHARDIVLKCAHCVSLLPQRPIGVNPRGLKPLHVWQMDITHIPEFGIKVIHGLPYNPQGQGIVERANATLKNTLIKQKGGIGMQFKSPRDKLNISLFILNF
ncbi:putative Pol polyprotein, partial [Trichinella sp. T9]